MLSANQLKKTLKRILPAPLVDIVQSARAHRHSPNPLVLKAKDDFEALNRDLRAEQIAMRPDLIWTVDPQSKDPFSWFCYRSPEMVGELDLFLKLRVSRSRFIDIGANHGVYSLAFTFGRPGTKALALDPSPLAFPILQRNIQLNPECDITPLQIAAGSAPGDLRMKLNWHHLEVIADQTAAESEQVKIVPVRTVDSLCEELNFHPDLIKVDVEGHELACLQGMDKILRHQRTEFFLEIHPELIEPLGYRLDDITTYLRGLDYKFWSLGGEQRSASWFNDQIHTFWLLCRPSN
ncbi:MAG: FkbM family methyltransferase [Nostoc sp.]|uniref:FkbM family methyltransferase n=1 Tax=Nostoc sp. TaxID=1180 RepID=UPI002FF8D937